MGPVIERIVEDVIFGEGPHWDVQSQCLYFVDYLTKSINRYVPATKSHFKAELENHSSFIIPVEGEKQKFVIGVEKDISIVTWDGVKKSVDGIHKLVKVDDFDNANILNDGKCDALGRLWTGILRTDIVDFDSLSTSETEETLTSKSTASFYSYSNGNLKKQFDDVDISNGIAWNKTNTKMFYNDSIKRRVDQFDFDVKTGEISNREILFSFTKNQIEGMPDGMTIDDDDNLWLAIFRGSKIIKISTRTPDTLLETVDMPAKQVTSVAWGGEKLDELYVTTGNFPEQGLTLKAPVDGSLYRITGLNARGLPMNNFRL